MWDKYLVPGSVKEALAYLDEHKGEGRVIAGGTDLVPQFRSQEKHYQCLVDITRIPELGQITICNGLVTVGGAVTHTQASSSEDINRYARVLAEASASVGSPQIRNQATLAGNIINAQPAADGAVALVSLDAEALIVSSKGQRLVPVKDLYIGPGKSRVDSGSEIIEKIMFKALDSTQHEASAFERLALRKALSLPMINVAVSLKVTEGKFSWVRIAIGPVAESPYRPLEAEEEAINKPADENSIILIAEKAVKTVRPRDSKLRGSAEYRKELVRVLIRRALWRALERIGGV